MLPRLQGDSRGPFAGVSDSAARDRPKYRPRYILDSEKVATAETTLTFFGSKNFKSGGAAKTKNEHNFPEAGRIFGDNEGVVYGIACSTPLRTVAGTDDITMLDMERMMKAHAIFKIAGTELFDVPNLKWWPAAKGVTAFMAGFTTAAGTAPLVEAHNNGAPDVGNVFLFPEPWFVKPGEIVNVDVNWYSGVGTMDATSMLELTLIAMTREPTR